MKQRPAPADPPATSIIDVLQLMKAAACQPGLRLQQTRVLVVIASYADHRNLTAFPSLRTISEWTGIDLRGVARAVKGLVAAGLLTVETAGNGRRSSRYRLDAEKVLSVGPGANAALAGEPTQGRLVSQRTVGSGANAGSAGEPTELPLKGQRSGPRKWPPIDGPLRGASRSASRPARAPLRANGSDSNEGWAAALKAEVSNG